MLGQASAANRRKEVREQEFIEPYGLVTQVEAGGIAQLIVAVRKEQMGGVVRVIVSNRSGGFAHTDFGHAGVAVDRGEVGAAHRPVFIEQEAGAEEAAIIVALLRSLKIPNRLVDPVLLLLQQRRVKPRGGIVRIKFTA